MRHCDVCSGNGTKQGEHRGAVELVEYRVHMGRCRVVQSDEACQAETCEVGMGLRKGTFFDELHNGPCRIHLGDRPPHQEVRRGNGFSVLGFICALNRASRQLYSRILVAK